MNPSMTSFLRRWALGWALCLAALLWVSMPAWGQIPAGWEASNMRPIGYSDLDGRGGAFKLAIKQVGGRWWMPGQKEGEPRLAQDIAIHGPAMIDGIRAYVGYGSSVVILDISNIASPKLIGRLDYSPPFRGGDLGVHSVQPIPGRNLLFANSEGTGGDAGNAPACGGPMDHASLVDISNPARPRLISIFPVPVPPVSKPYKTFCAKGSRFGPHNTNTLQHLPDVEKQGDLIYLTYFNAGLRIYDIKEAYLPKEVGWFIPPTPTKRLGPIPVPLESQVEDVLVDTRGNIYITDKQWGLWILRYTGQGQPAPTAR